ncbi:helix-turn-helix domain-containing protein [Vibrio harveyi]|uniref:helix-turn-helix domain-containing protein n=3 Tax=Vibrio TaxID=662 RepID=UPI003CFB5662
MTRQAMVFSLPFGFLNDCKGKKMTVVFEGVPLVRTEWVHDLAALFDNSNIDVHQLIKVSKAPEDIQMSDVEFLPETILRNLLLAFGESCPTDEFIHTIWTLCRDLYVPKVLAQLALTPTMTVAEAIEVFCHSMHRYSNNTRLGLEQYHDRIWFARYKDGENQPWYQYAEMFSLIFMDELVAALANYRQQTVSVSVKSTNMERFFDCRQLKHVQFYTNRAATGIQLDDAVLNKTICMPNKGRFDGSTDLSEVPTSFVSSFGFAILPYISFGRFSILEAAQILGIHKRTLQRRLHDCEVTYSQVMESLLLERSLSLLKNSTLSITTIAASLGYADTANFTRFIRRKIGMTPSAYRKT